MAKQATKAPTTPATPATPRKRGAAYKPESTIRVVSGEGQRRVVKNLSCDRALQHMGGDKGTTVARYLAAFGPLCDKAPLPGRSGQPGATQAAAILRYLEREGAVVVATK